MIPKSAEYVGAALLQTGLPNSNVLCSDGDGLIFKPSLPDEDVDVLAYLTHHPVESSNVLWDNVKLDLTRQTDLLTADFELIISLLGLGTSGDEAIIGEKIITTCPTTELSETIIFDLLKSSCQPAFSKSSDTAPAGKIRLNLPMRWKNFESASLTKQWLDGWPKRKLLPITGASADLYAYPIGPITIPYVTGMSADFSDVRFVDSDGQTILPNYWLESYTASSTATFYLNIPLITKSINRNIYLQYGNSSAAYIGNGNNVFSFFDDFNDNSIDTTKWKTVLTSGATIAETNQEIQITGNGSVRSYLRNLVSKTSQYVLEFWAKRSSTGSVECVVGWDGVIGGSGIKNAPYNGYHIIFTGTTAQIDEYVNGVGINRALKAFSFNTNYQKVTVNVKSNGLNIVVNGSWVMSYYPNTFKSGYFGFTNNWAASGLSTCYNNVRTYQFAGSVPTIGTLGNEESTITVQPDTPDPEQTYIDFTTPADWSNDSYSYITTRKIGNYDQNTRVIPISNLNVLDLGYDAVSKYYALRTKIESNCNSDYNFGVTKETFAYLY
ncbi:MAG: DUF2341 domain-containing protein [Methanobacterium paludis]|nr:DUF2341 domain-containing protein [Methanobacterium paludis]